MNFMNIICDKFSDMSCKDLRKEKKQLEVEIKRRQDKKISEINLEYKEKERIIRARFNEMATELGTAIPVEPEFSNDIVNELTNYFISFANEYHHNYRPFGSRYFPNIRERVINLVSILSHDKSHNLILALAMEVELEKLDNDRLSDISKVREVI